MSFGLRRFGAHGRSMVRAIPVFGAFVAGCAAHAPARIVPRAAAPFAPTFIVFEDTAPKASLRLVPPEVYLRTYMDLFGGLAPLDVQTRARGADGAKLFDAWDDYVSALGLPDYRVDTPRQVETNALMVATFERLGIALCDRAVEHDLAVPVGGQPAARKERLIFAFDLPEGDMNAGAFAPRFDVLHRTFLGYPVSLAPPARLSRFYALYQNIAAGHERAAPHSRFTPSQAGWAAVCYGLVRHPEAHLY